MRWSPSGTSGACHAGLWSKPLVPGSPLSDSRGRDLSANRQAPTLLGASHGSWASTLTERRYRGVFAEVFAVAEGLEEAVAEEFEFIQDGEACRPRGEWLAAQSGDGSPQSESVGGMSCGIGVPLRDVGQ